MVYRLRKTLFIDYILQNGQMGKDLKGENGQHYVMCNVLLDLSIDTTILTADHHY